MCLHYQAEHVPEQYDLMIAAHPAMEFVYMVTHDDGKLDAVEDERIYSFYDDMDIALSKLMSKYDFRIISVYGPQDYIDKIADEIEMNYTEFHVNRIGA